VKLTAIRDREELGELVARRLDEIHTDRNLQGSVLRSIRPLLAALPQRVVLTAATIESLGLDPHAEAYLVFEMCRRAWPDSLHLRRAGTSLGEVMREAAGRIGTDWLYESTPTADPRDSWGLELAHNVKWQHDFELRPIEIKLNDRDGHAWNLTMRVDCLRANEEPLGLGMTFFPPIRLLEWEVKVDYRASQVSLSGLPHSILRAIRSALVAFLPGHGDDLMLSHLRSLAKAEDLQMLGAERLLAELDKLLAARDVDVALAAIEAFKRGELSELVGVLPAHALNVAAKQV
jgi:hypothetical protein